MDEYARQHANRTNLLIHIVMVPAFVVGALSVPYAIVVMDLANAVVGAIMMLAGLGLQGSGHKKEEARPNPFAGAGDFIGRIFIEQFVTFPRFVLSGCWLRSWKASGS